MGGEFRGKGRNLQEKWQINSLAFNLLTDSHRGAWLLQMYRDDA